MSFSATLFVFVADLSCVPYNPGRLFRRGIFSKPSPSTKAPTSNHILAHSRWLEWGLSEWKRPAAELQQERHTESSVTKIIELQIRD